MTPQFNVEPIIWPLQQSRLPDGSILIRCGHKILSTALPPDSEGVRDVLVWRGDHGLRRIRSRHPAQSLQYYKTAYGHLLPTTTIPQLRAIKLLPQGSPTGHTLEVVVVVNSRPIGWGRERVAFYRDKSGKCVRFVMDRATYRHSVALTAQQSDDIIARVTCEWDIPVERWSSKITF